MGRDALKINICNGNSKPILANLLDGVTKNEVVLTVSEDDTSYA